MEPCQLVSATVVAILSITLIGLPTLAWTIAQPPADTRQTLELPDLPDFQPPKVRANPQRDAKVQQIIGDALKKGEHPETGDPVLDDADSSEGGSILAGFDSGPRGSRATIREDQRNQSVSAKARAAECLLKAARKLEKVEPIDKTRRDLVNQMRRESVRLLARRIRAVEIERSQYRNVRTRIHHQDSN